MAKARVSKKTNGVARPVDATPAEVTPIDSVTAPAVETTSADIKRRTKKAGSELETPVPTLVKPAGENGGSHPGDITANDSPNNVEDEIRQLAYLFSERRGFIPGHENDDWFAAEHEVRQRYQHHA